jgi:hypothetical protein
MGMENSSPRKDRIVRIRENIIGTLFVIVFTAILTALGPHGPF